MSSLHSSLSKITTSIPFDLRWSSPPKNVLFSATTTRATLYRIQAPVHISQGLSEVYMVAPLYAEAGRRPEFSSADISPCLCVSILSPIWYCRDSSKNHQT